MERLTSDILENEYFNWIGGDKGEGFIKFIYENFLIPDFSPRSCNAKYKSDKEGFEELHGKLVVHEDAPMPHTVKIRMGAKSMADLMYAVIITESKITSTYCMCKKCTRKENSYNHADVLVMIKPSKISKFSELSGIERINKYTYPKAQ